jgi:hypothetical protein
MRKHKGLRLSVIGAVIALTSIALLIVLPDLGPSIGLLIGGAMVWGGLLWTLFGYYVPPGESTPPS